MNEEMQKDLAEIKELLEHEHRITKEENICEPNDAGNIKAIKKGE